MTYLDQVAAVKLTGAKLIRAHDLMVVRRRREVARGEEFDLTSAMIALVQAVPEDFSREEVPAVVFRLQALNALLRTEDMKGWAQQHGRNPTLWFVNEALLDAVAVAELDLTGPTPAFKHGDVRNLALKVASPDGKA